MPRLKRVLSSIAVGFPENTVPAALAEYLGQARHAVGPELPLAYEDAQFDMALAAASVLDRDHLLELHRVLKREGMLVFILPVAATAPTLEEVYRGGLKYGFDVIAVEQPRWWARWFGGHRELKVFARRKAWREISLVKPGGSNVNFEFRNRI